MNIVVVDDEKPVRKNLVDTIQKVRPDAVIHDFEHSSDLLEFVQNNPCDIAFLDIQIRNTNGVELAKKLKDILPKVNIIFVTGYNEYVMEAMKIHASGYILKPATEESVEAELKDLRHPIVPLRNALLRVQCFGNFDAFTCDGELLHFERSKAKETFAYLVHRHGASSTIKEIAAILFEDDPYNFKQQRYMQKIISSMMKTLREAGAGEVIQKDYNSLAVKTDMIDCDYYRFEKMDTGIVNAYAGEYMSQYSWAEFVVGYLERESYK